VHALVTGLHLLWLASYRRRIEDGEFVTDESNYLPDDRAPRL
jgi:hypothetical protein